MKKFFALILLFCIVFSCFASGKTEESGLVTVVDQTGRTVNIDRIPERIVSGYYISSSACIAMGLKDKLVAIESQADKRPIYKLAAPELIEKPHVGTAKSFNLEVCLSVNPDLVILPKKQKDTADTLQELGIPTMVVNPENHQQIMEMFELIGEISGNKKEASKLINSYSKILKTVYEKNAKVSEKPRVYMCGTGTYLKTAPKDMYQSDLIEMAGGTNAASSLEGSSWKEISYEQFLSFNPDVIIIPTNSNANGTPNFSVEDILKDPQLKELTAIKNKAVYQMPVGFESWDSPVPSGALGALWMIHTLHPELCSEKEFRNTVNSFYRDLYGFDPNF